jgi:hypothetical protein
VRALRFGKSVSSNCAPSGLIGLPGSEPDITIELTRPGLRALIFGARASEIEHTGDLSIQGNRRRAHALLNTLTGPPRLAGLAAGDRAQP